MSCSRAAGLRGLRSGGAALSGLWQQDQRCGWRMGEGEIEGGTASELLGQYLSDAVHAPGGEWLRLNGEINSR